MTAPGRPAPGDQLAADGDADRWREAAWLRRDHPGWIVVWVAAVGAFHAYKRLPGARRDTALAAATADDLAAQIDHAEQNAPHHLRTT